MSRGEIINLPTMAPKRRPRVLAGRLLATHLPARTRGRRMILPLLGRLEMALAADRLVLPIMEVSGSIWVLENVDR